MRLTAKPIEIMAEQDALNNGEAESQNYKKDKALVKALEVS